MHALLGKWMVSARLPRNSNFKVMFTFRINRINASPLGRWRLRHHCGVLSLILRTVEALRSGTTLRSRGESSFMTSRPALGGDPTDECVVAIGISRT